MRFAILDTTNKVTSIIDIDSNKLEFYKKSLKREIIPVDDNIKVGFHKHNDIFINPNEALNVAPTIESKMEMFKQERDRLFKETAWIRERHKDRVEAKIDDPTWQEWLKYWEELRTMPNKKGFDVNNYTFPKQPK